MTTSRSQLVDFDIKLRSNPLKYYHHNEEFMLESGEHFMDLRLAYHTFGTLNSDKDNVVWVVHALTANSNPTEWWSDIVRENGIIDPERHYIVCVNCIGSPYGSTFPLDIDPQRKEVYYKKFPIVTTRDMARALDLVRIHLGIKKIKLLVGASMGGQQAVEWSILAPKVIENLLLIATNANHSSWGKAFNESQRMAIEADQSWATNQSNAGLQGLKVARSIALLSYRSQAGYNASQKDNDEQIDFFNACSYQRYQGQKLANRFNAYSYWFLSKMMDSHNVGRGRKSIEDALSLIEAKTTIVGISTDLLFPIIEQKLLSECIKDAKLVVIESSFGHDGFLTDSKKIGKIIEGVLGD